LRGGSPADGLFDIVHFERGHLNFAPLRRFGFGLGASGSAAIGAAPVVISVAGAGIEGVAGRRVFRWVGARLTRPARPPRDLLRHLPEELARAGAGRERVHVAGVARVALHTVRFFGRRQTLEVSVDA